MNTPNAEAHRFRRPLLQGILPISASQIPAEIVAGITLAALSIPEVLGYTKISGTPVVTGLYTILIPMTLFALLGSSRHLVVGADSATAAILAGALTATVERGSAEWLMLAQVLALLSAILLIIARIIGLGFLSDFLSRTVLIGFLTGVGVQVAVGEISGMLGLPGGVHGPFRMLWADIRQIDQTNAPSLVISVAVLAVVIGSRKISKKIPGALIAVIGAIVASSVLDLKAQGVHVLGAVPSGLPKIGLPDAPWSWELVLKLLPTAVAMFVVILAQSAATSRAYAARYGERFSADIDLVGLGFANIGAALSGTFVVNGSPTKTQMVDSAGGRTQLSQVVTSLIVLMVLLFLTGPLEVMPTPVLSAVVFLIGVELVDISGMRKISVQAPTEFRVALLTALVVVFVGVKQGILFAMALSLMDHVRRSYRPKNAVVGIDDSGAWKALPVSAASQIRPGLMVYRFTHTMYYANAERLSEEVSELVSGAKPPVSWFCIEASAVAGVDYTAAQTLRSIYKKLKEKGIRLVFANVYDETVRTELERFELTGLFGTDAFFPSLPEVISAYEKEAGGPAGRK